jgi:chemotaxis protein MotA
MNILLLLGLIVGFGGVLGGFMTEGGMLANLVNAAPIMIVLGGTIGIALIAFPFSTIKKVPGALKAIMFHKKRNYAKLVDMLCEIANKARKDGLLSLESEADKIPDQFIKRGLGYIADGVDPEFLKKVLNNEIESAYKRLEGAAKVFESMGGTSPTMGVLGTVMGMTTVLGSMGSDTAALGEHIASAFLATMYGIGIANLIWLPIGSHIKVVAEEESEYQEVVLEGLMAIQSGEPSSRLRDRLFAKIGTMKSKKTSAAPKAES